MPFARSIFVNCPFDDAYLQLLRPLLFTVIHLGFVPRIASERTDSGEARIDKIFSLIEQSKFAIHDLSRIRASKIGELFRLNMPFELGLDVACRRFKRGRWSEKTCLILESEPYRYKAALSDISNSDIAVHNDEPAEVVREVRNWIVNQAKIVAPGPSLIWGRFNEFMGANYDALKAEGYSDKDINKLPVPELIQCIQDWLRNNSPSGKPSTTKRKR
jgi:hypothetical protein